MSYESAPATRLVAKSCAACGRPLVDAESVDAGMGPYCRRRYGYHRNVPAETRAAANRLIRKLAAEGLSGIQAAEAAAELRSLGLGVLAERIEKRVCAIRVMPIGADQLLVQTPLPDASKRPAFTAAWRAIPGARWVPSKRANVVSSARKADVWALLRQFFAGSWGSGPRGVFRIQ